MLCNAAAFGEPSLCISQSALHLLSAFEKAIWIYDVTSIYVYTITITTPVSNQKNLQFSV